MRISNSATTAQGNGKVSGFSPKKKDTKSQEARVDEITFGLFLLLATLTFSSSR